MSNCKSQCLHPSFHLFWRGELIRMMTEPLPRGNENHGHRNLDAHDCCIMIWLANDIQCGIAELLCCFSYGCQDLKCTSVSPRLSFTPAVWCLSLISERDIRVSPLPLDSKSQVNSTDLLAWIFTCAYAAASDMASDRFCWCFNWANMAVTDILLSRLPMSSGKKSTETEHIHKSLLRLSSTSSRLHLWKLLRLTWCQSSRKKGMRSKGRWRTLSADVIGGWAYTTSAL